MIYYLIRFEGFMKSHCEDEGVKYTDELPHRQIFVIILIFLMGFVGCVIISPILLLGRFLKEKGCN